MGTIRKFAAALCGLCLAVSFGATADNTDGPTFDEIREQQVELRGAVARGEGIYEGLSSSDRETLIARQDELLALIEGKDVVEDLADEEQVQAFNLLQEINATVNALVNTVDDDDRVVCEYVASTGSHRKQKRCATVAERREQREHAQRAMQKTLDRFCSPAAGTCGG